MPANQGSQKRYPPELKERAVRMVFETIAETGERHGVIGRVARQLGIGDQSLRTWVAQAEIEGGKRAGLTAEPVESRLPAHREHPPEKVLREQRIIAWIFVVLGVAVLLLGIVVLVRRGI
jgi:transposase